MDSIAEDTDTATPGNSPPRVSPGKSNHRRVWSVGFGGEQELTKLKKHQEVEILQSELEKQSKALEESQEETQLAARIGQSLLLQNQQLDYEIQDKLTKLELRCEEAEANARAMELKWRESNQQCRMLDQLRIQHEHDIEGFVQDITAQKAELKALKDEVTTTKCGGETSPKPDNRQMMDELKKRLVEMKQMNGKLQSDIDKLRVYTTEMEESNAELTARVAALGNQAAQSVLLGEKFTALQVEHAALALELATAVRRNKKYILSNMVQKAELVAREQKRHEESEQVASLTLELQQTAERLDMERAMAKELLRKHEEVMVHAPVGHSRVPSDFNFSTMTGTGKSDPVTAGLKHGSLFHELSIHLEKELQSQTAATHKAGDVHVEKLQSRVAELTDALDAASVKAEDVAIWTEEKRALESRVQTTQDKADGKLAVLVQKCATAERLVTEWKSKHNVAAGDMDTMSKLHDDMMTGAQIGLEKSEKAVQLLRHDLTKSRDEYNTALQHLRAELAALQTANETLQNECGAERDQRKSLEIESQELVEEALHRAVRAEAELVALESKHKTLSVNFQTLETKHEHVVMHLETTTSHLHQVEAQLRAQTDQIAGLNSELKHVTEQWSGSDTKEPKKATTAAGARHDKRSSYAVDMSAGYHIAHLKELLVTAADEQARAAAEWDVERTELEAVHAELVTKATELREQLQDAEREAKVGKWMRLKILGNDLHVQAKNDRHEHALKTIQAAMDEKTQELTDAMQITERLRDDLKKARGEHTSEMYLLETGMSQLQATLETLQTAYAADRTRWRTLETEGEAAADEAQRRVVDMEAAMAALEQKHKITVLNFQALETKHEHLQLHLETTTTRLHEVEATSKNGSSQVAALTQELAQVTQLLQLANEAKAELGLQNEELKCAANDAQKTDPRTLQEMAELTEALATATQLRATDAAMWSEKLHEMEVRLKSNQEETDVKASEVRNQLTAADRAAKVCHIHEWELKHFTLTRETEILQRQHDENVDTAHAALVKSEKSLQLLRDEIVKVRDDHTTTMHQHCLDMASLQTAHEALHIKYQSESTQWKALEKEEKTATEAAQQQAVEATEALAALTQKHKTMALSFQALETKHEHLMLHLETTTTRLHEVEDMMHDDSNQVTTLTQELQQVNELWNEAKETNAQLRQQNEELNNLVTAAAQSPAKVRSDSEIQRRQLLKRGSLFHELSEHLESEVQRVKDTTVELASVKAMYQVEVAKVDQLRQELLHEHMEVQTAKDVAAVCHDTLHPLTELSQHALSLEMLQVKVLYNREVDRVHTLEEQVARLKRRQSIVVGTVAQSPPLTPRSTMRQFPWDIQIKHIPLYNLQEAIASNHLVVAVPHLPSDLPPRP
ncbi:Aste57867_21254 [Aphanomyces stellatus]|uniref:Aste57867_21254 protein n=1 Tax=Aphanomyces stellatus TaxID=120398 RepID=A0A485LLN8_9STRA|nr:hypothetical protein As57867_021185 [Aphanomyces stellatus]VFT97926.1 Aste57867_21254 [Aphanomyces stellatus]